MPPMMVFISFKKFPHCLRACTQWNRIFSTASDSKDESCVKKPNMALVVGVYSNAELLAEDQRYATLPPELTESGQKYDDMACNKLTQAMVATPPAPGLGAVRVFYDMPNFNSVAVVGLGNRCLGYNELEMRDDRKEAIRIAAAAGCRALQDYSPMKIFVDSMGHAESAAEGAALGIWLYQELRSRNDQTKIPQIELYDSCDYVGWQIGLQKAEAQNLARQMMETPANVMTPTTFAQNAVELLCGSGVNTEVKVRSWAESQGMGGFLNVAKGSCEPPVFLELSYYGTSFDERPITLVGKGITFDSGGLCFKNPLDMLTMKGDMCGAAVVIAVTRAIALLQLPVNIRGLIPLCENMPGCLAYKPGDIITTMSGKNVLVENTDCEGRLVVADVLWYSQNFWPKFVVDIGSFTMDIRNVIGDSASGIWTNSDNLWEHMKMAAIHTGDRLWRMPLWGYYTRQIKTSRSVDLKNVGAGAGGGCNKTAAFLKEFVPCGEWVHIDNFGTMFSNGDAETYLRRGMSGRPTRTLIECISAMTCKQQ